MKLILSWLSLVLAAQPLLAEGPLPMYSQASSPVQALSIEVTNRRPIQLASVRELATYADSNHYDFSVNLKPGMRVMYSASYGIGGEAAQARGVVVERQGRFFFKQDGNPSQNLLLPPGLSLNSSDNVSLWDLGAYMDLINRVAFSHPNSSFQSTSDVYDRPDAALVDFRGGTAGESVFYADALEAVFERPLPGRAGSSDWKVYYAKGTGPVALEFREDRVPAGTFKFYVGAPGN